MLRPRTFQTRWLVPSFATGDGKHSPLPWRPDGKVAEQRKDAANDRGRSRASGSAVLAPAGGLLRGAPTFEDLRVTPRQVRGNR